MERGPMWCKQGKPPTRIVCKGSSLDSRVDTWFPFRGGVRIKKALFGLVGGGVDLKKYVL